MSYPIRDRRVLEAIEPDDLQAFLSSVGFRLIGPDSSHADVWGNSAIEDGTELLVPRSKRLSDYSLRMAELFVTLSAALERSPEDLIRAVSGSVADIVRVRRPSFNEADASVRLRDGAAIISGALDIMAAAACSAVSPRAVLPPRRPNQAVDYMRRVELGQSERGSYVVSLISRIAPLLTPGTPGLLEFIDDPFPRRVTLTLASALSATKTAATRARERGDLSVFGEEVQRGLSSNLCDTLGNLLEDEESTTSLAFSISWARSRPSPVDEVAPYRFGPEDGAVLKEGAAFLRNHEPQVRVLLTGVVTDLHREPTDPDGEVSVSTVIDGSPRKLRTPLTGPDYRAAIEAHDEKLPVIFRADIAKVGRLWRAANVAEFRVIRQ